jgi:WD40 repeat protein
MDAHLCSQVTAVSVGLDKGVFFWDVRQDKPIRVVPNAHLHEITCCAINARGSVVATGSADCMVKLWDLNSGKALGAFAGHTSTVNKLQFSPDDNQLASVADDGSMVLWRMNV